MYVNHLAHSYWGSRLNQIPDLEHYYPLKFGADFSATDIPGRRFNSTDKLPREYPTYGTGDMRSPALQVENAAGDSITSLRYEGHRIFEGKPGFSGLPATYGDDCETLEITISDEVTGLTAFLYYTVFPEKDVLTRSVRMKNRGNTACRLEKVASYCLDLHRDGFEVIHLHGAWAKERHIQRIPQSAATMFDDSAADKYINTGWKTWGNLTAEETAALRSNGIKFTVVRYGTEVTLYVGDTVKLQAKNEKITLLP